MPTDDFAFTGADPTTDEHPAVSGPDDGPPLDPDQAYVEPPAAPRSSRRATVFVVVLLLVISGAIGVLLGLGSGQAHTGQRPVTTLAPEPPTTAPTSTATVPASTTPP